MCVLPNARSILYNNLNKHTRWFSHCRFIDISGINDPHGLNFLFIGIYYIC